jgi:hypothetical protein
MNPRRWDGLVPLEEKSPAQGGASIRLGRKALLLPWLSLAISWLEFWRYYANCLEGLQSPVTRRKVFL